MNEPNFFEPCGEAVDLDSHVMGLSDGDGDGDNGGNGGDVVVDIPSVLNQAVQIQISLMPKVNWFLLTDGKKGFK